MIGKDSESELITAMTLAAEIIAASIRDAGESIAKALLVTGLSEEELEGAEYKDKEQEEIERVRRLQRGE